MATQDAAVVGATVVDAKTISIYLCSWTKQEKYLLHGHYLHVQQKDVSLPSSCFLSSHRFS